MLFLIRWGHEVRPLRSTVWSAAARVMWKKIFYSKTYKSCVHNSQNYVTKIVCDFGFQLVENEI